MDILHREVESAVRLPEVFDLYDVWVVNAGAQVRLFDEHPVERRVTCEVPMHDLEGHVPGESANPASDREK